MKEVVSEQESRMSVDSSEKERKEVRGGQE